jgi:hypothetical protein
MMNNETPDTRVNVEVLIRVFQEDDAWVAVGFGIDYCAQGANREEAIEHFKRGLELTWKERGARGLCDELTPLKGTTFRE